MNIFDFIMKKEILFINKLVIKQYDAYYLKTICNHSVK